MPELRDLCYRSVRAGVQRLIDIGTWPRPPLGRRLHLGSDFYINQIDDIEEVRVLLEYLASDDRLRSIYVRDSTGSASYVFWQYWLQLLIYILHEGEGTWPTARVFNKWFQRFVKELYAETVVWRVVNTIIGLELRASQFSLDPITKLVSIPGYDIFRLVKGHEYYFSSDGRRFLNHGWLGVGGLDECCLVTTVSIQKREYTGSIKPYPHLVGDIDRSLAFMKAIRLIKPGVQNLHGRADFHMSYFPLREPLAYCYEESSHTLHQHTILEKKDFSRVRKLWKELLENKPDDFLRRPSPLGAIDTALARFTRTYTIKNWLDDIVDLTIALEALIGPGDNQELSHRIALRASWLLEKEADSGNNRIYEIVRTMYRIRSARVHGTSPNEKNIHKWLGLLTGTQYDELEQSGISDWEICERAIESVRQVTRKAINACMNLRKLDKHGPHWPLPKDFDKNIVCSKERSRWQKAAKL